MTRPAQSSPHRLAALVMDPERNPLRRLPRPQRFQTMAVLSVMWTTIFCAAAGAWYLYDELVIGHMLVIVGIFATAFTFRSARGQVRTYRDYPREDGTARYSDVWGG